jgi:hypothetical protein
MMRDSVGPFAQQPMAAATVDVMAAPRPVQTEVFVPLLNAPAKPDFLSPVGSYWDKLHRMIFLNSAQCETDYLKWAAEIPSINCDCRKKWRQLTNETPPDFSNEERFFAWGWSMHNKVNESIGKPVFPLREAYGIHKPVWVPTTEEIKKPTSKRLIITIAVGDKYGEMLEISRPLMEAYATRCGADFVALTNPTQKWWGLEKFRVKQFQQHYERAIFFDADLLIKPETPDLFEIVNAAKIGIHNDNLYNPGNTEGWLVNERSALLNSQGVHLADYSEPVCFNTGVVVFSRDHDIWNGMQKPFPMNHCDEQFWIEYQSQRYPIQQLNYRFNNQYWFGKRFRIQNPASYIIHFSGCVGRDRLAMMKEELKLWNAAK